MRNVPPPCHVAIIMDGNGRWARRRGLSRIAGHREGANAVRRAVEAAPGLGIRVLTLYAFSADNWQRPAVEVGALMELLRSYLRKEWRECAEKGVRINVIGRRDRLDRRILREIERAERLTRHAGSLHMRIAIDYSSREAIMKATEATARAPQTQESFSRLLNRAIHSDPPAPDVDLLIRTSGEQRLSDFLLWECAYAEMVFTDQLWPDFSAEDLAGALAAYQERERRFGRIVESPDDVRHRPGLAAASSP